MADWPYNTTAWKRLRLAHLSIEPMCRGCKDMGRLTRANTVDHITAISDGGHAFPGHEGLASYCGPCHGAKTARRFFPADDPDAPDDDGSGNSIGWTSQ